MLWIIASIIMYLASAMLYLAIRKAQLQKIAIETYSLFMFGFPIIIFILISLFAKPNFLLSYSQLIQIIVIAVLFSWLGNYLSQKSILHAPNPGYPLIISKSYVVFTSIAAVFLFNSQLNLQSIIAIVLIITSSTLIILNKDKTKKPKIAANSKWFAYALGAFFCWGLLALASKHILNQGVNILIWMLYLRTIVTLLLVGEIKIKHIKLVLTKNDFFILFFIGLTATIFEAAMQIGIKYAPNPGYINAVNAGSISLVTLLSAILYKDALSIGSLLGVLGVSAGLLLLLI